jgi:hypothetical protein
MVLKKSKKKFFREGAILKNLPSTEIVWDFVKMYKNVCSFENQREHLFQFLGNFRKNLPVTQDGARERVNSTRSVS